MQGAKDLDDEEAAPFEESNCYYKLFNTPMGAAFYFKNGERAKTLNASFDMAIENLAIQGEPAGAQSFEFTLPPGGECYKLLKPVVEGEATSIQMRYEYNLVWRPTDISSGQT